METKSQEAEPTHHSLVRGGLSYRLARRFGFEPPTLERRLTKVVLLVVVTWVPLVGPVIRAGARLGARGRGAFAA